MTDGSEIETCQSIHDDQLPCPAEAGHHQDQDHGGQGGQQDHGEQLGPRVGHLGNDQLAADVGEHSPRQVEHAPRVKLEDVVGRPTDPDEKQ